MNFMDIRYEKLGHLSCRVRVIKRNKMAVF